MNQETVNALIESVIQEAKLKGLTLHRAQVLKEVIRDKVARELDLGPQAEFTAEISQSDPSVVEIHYSVPRAILSDEEIEELEGLNRQDGER